jgi:vancomycin resistance protein YoaR
MIQPSLMSKGVNSQRGAVLIGLASALFIAAGSLVASYLWMSRSRQAPALESLTPAQVAARPPSKQDFSALPNATVEMVVGGASIHLKWRDVGASVDAQQAKLVTGDLVALAKAGNLPMMIDRKAAEVALRSIKAQYDQSAIGSYLDLENRTVTTPTPGRGLDLYAAIAQLEMEVRSGAIKVTLPMVDIPGAAAGNVSGVEDISHVLGKFTTKFSVSDKDRNFNLKLAASKLHGYVLQPGVEFSFNDVVGERSEKAGYKIAHVIDAGEMVDGLAGGTCQISTTLFGASFFAGLEIVKTTNHSRPSTYTPLGFDATVVWPNTDLKLRNPYDFPVVISYRVTNGESTVQLLGKKRPWDKIVFERNVVESTPYPTEERLDDTMPMDQTTLDQGGFDGYTLMRYRKFYRGKQEVKTEKWKVEYKPVTEYVRRGTSEDPAAKMPPKKEIHLPTAPDKDSFSLAQ